MTQHMESTTDERRKGIEAEARAKLAELGIDALVKRVEPRVTHEVDLLTMSAVDHDQSPRPHTPPQVPVVINGEVNEPRTVHEFDGQALYSTPGFRKEELVLYMFTDMEKMSDHLRTQRLDRPLVRHETTIGTSNPDSCPVNARYSEHDHGGGDWLWNGPALGWLDLKKVGRGFLHLGDWNDIISSTDFCRWHVTLFDRPNYGGNRFEIPAGIAVNHLTPFGWNDCVSSTFNWGRRF
ncbi:hypothetical protein [Streptomyces lasalocidi]|uniref:Uncharacterized protein n=1 Tax=Streptomyces lasalocidi TaxID=324833 RepID=A0A4U5W613_STRLS|nr:hypothetical protein [Streptomyces lasalocidi]TKS96361.1 hypothetical protein E4U91_37480 [Streptomyces lasalocidi]